MKPDRYLKLALAFFVLPLATEAAPRSWWDDFPRVVGSSSLPSARDYHASAAMNSVANDPGWGLWFAHATDAGSSTRRSFEAAGVRSLSYNESFGEGFAPIAELQWDAGLQHWKPRHHFWNWESYSNGPIVWAGAWNWFDSFLADSPANPSEASYFARPFTRLHPQFGGPPMTYPDGTVATGFFDNDPTDPRKSRVYDAGAAKDILGQLTLSFNYNTSADDKNEPHAGCLWVPADGKYSGLVLLAHDSACPLWADYARASTLAAVQLTGLHGTWTDNFGPWDSFGNGGPVHSGFGEWSVARFRPYLTNHFTEAQLKAWGVLATNGTLDDIAGFDARAFFRTVASNKFAWTDSSLTHAAWKNGGWLNEPVWHAYCIFKRQAGTETLNLYDQSVHAAAIQGGLSDFALLVNDISPASFGWARGNFDLTSTELSLSWSLTGGPRGFGLPPFGRVGPFCKAAREHGRSRFVTVWLYNDGYQTALSNVGPASALFYEMLASHGLPKFNPGDGHFAGPPSAQQDFFKFVAEQAAPEFGGRVPVEEVGIYFSSSSILAMALPGDAFNFSKQDHQCALWGWGTALSQLHYQYRFVPEWKLSRDLLRTLRVLIVPNAAAFDPADVPTLQSWVRDDGGFLIVTGDSGSRLGESGNFDSTNNLVLAPVTGVTNYSAAPTDTTNCLGAGFVRYLKSNLGRTYYDATAAGRGTQLPTLASVITNAFNLLGAQPMLLARNAPATVGLTLYEETSVSRTFVDLNNLNVNTNTLVTTPSPMVDVSLRRPVWWTNGVNADVRAISPDGPLRLDPPVIDGDRVRLRLPPITNYVSAILEPVWLGVSVTSPADGAVLSNLGTVTLSAVASGNATVTNMALLMNGALLGNFTQPPCSITLSNLACDRYTLIAVAANDRGLVATSAPIAFTIAATQSYLRANTLWRFLDNGVDQGTAWCSSSFNDVGWKTGRAQLGFGDGDEVTLVSSNRQITTYFRATLVVDEPTNVLSMSARLIRGDGALVYLNGREIWRDNLLTNVSITYTSLAGRALDAWEENAWLTQTISPELLLRGTNVLAAEIHQASVTSSNLSFDFELGGTVIVPPTPTSLRIASASGTVMLAYPASALFTLATATNLGPLAVWLPVPLAPVLSNGFWVISLPAPTNRSTYYRLQKRRS